LGPFCSQRRKLIDFGKWVGGEHVIFGPLRSEYFAKFADLPAGKHLDHPED